MEEFDDYREEELFKRGAQADTCFMILAGKAGVVSGEEEFYSEVGNFGVLGWRAISQEKYIPDFSAKVIGESRLLRISRDLYKKVFS